MSTQRKAVWTLWAVLLAGATAVAQITIPNTFVNGTAADAPQVNANFTALGAGALNRTGGTMTGTLTTQNIAATSDATYDVGASGVRFRDAFFSRNVTIAGTTTLNALAYTWPASQTAGFVLSTNGSGALSWITAAPLDIGVCRLRLTLESTVPVSTTDQTAKSSVFVTPVNGGQCSFYDGSATWTTLTNAEVTVAVPATTSTLYDVWCRNNSGTIACDTTAWTNDTTRATALTTQNNVRVKSGDTTRRFIGAFRTTGVSGQTEDSLAKRYVWSYYQRALRPLRVTEATSTWAYTTDTYRQARASATNQLDVVVGWNEVPLDVQVTAFAINDTGDVQVWASIGEDGTTPASNVLGVAAVARPGTTIYSQVQARLQKQPAVGRHFYTWLERSTASNTTTWVGTNGDATKWQAGIFGWIEG